MTRTVDDITIDRMRERKFRLDIKSRLSLSGLKITIIVDGLLVEYPNGESCTLLLRTKRK